jgi:hypothetical protein
MFRNRLCPALMRATFLRDGGGGRTLHGFCDRPTVVGLIGRRAAPALDVAGKHERDAARENSESQASFVCLTLHLNPVRVLLCGETESSSLLRFFVGGD